MKGKSGRISEWSDRMYIQNSSILVRHFESFVVQYITCLTTKDTKFVTKDIKKSIVMNYLKYEIKLLLN